MHQNVFVRLTVNLDPDLYALAKSLSKAEDCTLSAAVNRLLHRSLPGKGVGDKGAPKPVPAQRNGFTISRGAITITDDLVRSQEAEDD